MLISYQLSNFLMRNVILVALRFFFYIKRSLCINF